MTDNANSTLLLNYYVQQFAASQQGTAALPPRPRDREAAEIYDRASLIYAQRVFIATNPGAERYLANYAAYYGAVDGQGRRVVRGARGGFVPGENPLLDSNRDGKVGDGRIGELWQNVSGLWEDASAHRNNDAYTLRPGEVADYEQARAAATAIAQIQSRVVAGRPVGRVNIADALASTVRDMRNDYDINPSVFNPLTWGKDERHIERGGSTHDYHDDTTGDLRDATGTGVGLPTVSADFVRSTANPIFLMAAAPRAVAELLPDTTLRARVHSILAGEVPRAGKRGYQDISNYLATRYEQERDANNPSGANTYRLALATYQRTVEIEGDRRSNRLTPAIPADYADRALRTAHSRNFPHVTIPASADPVNLAFHETMDGISRQDQGLVVGVLRDVSQGLVGPGAPADPSTNAHFEATYKQLAIRALVANSMGNTSGALAAGRAIAVLRRVRDIEAARFAGSSTMPTISDGNAYFQDSTDMAMGLLKNDPHLSEMVRQQLTREHLEGAQIPDPTVPGGTTTTTTAAIVATIRNVHLSNAVPPVVVDASLNPVIAATGRSDITVPAITASGQTIQAVAGAPVTAPTGPAAAAPRPTTPPPRATTPPPPRRADTTPVVSSYVMAKVGIVPPSTPPGRQPQTPGPGFSLPHIDWPELHMPHISLPHISMPHIDWPHFSLPDFSGTAAASPPAAPRTPRVAAPRAEPTPAPAAPVPRADAAPTPVAPPRAPAPRAADTPPPRPRARPVTPAPVTPAPVTPAAPAAPSDARVIGPQGYTTANNDTLYALARQQTTALDQVKRAMGTTDDHQAALALALLIARKSGISNADLLVDGITRLQMPSEAEIAGGIDAMRSGILSNGSISYTHDIRGHNVASLVPTLSRPPQTRQ